MDEIRCPFRVRAHDAPDCCDERCAWLMKHIDGDDGGRACAVALMARGPIWYPANVGRAE